MWIAGYSDSRRHVIAYNILSLALFISLRKGLGTCRCQPSDLSLFPGDGFSPCEAGGENDIGNKCFCRGSFHSCSASWLLPCPFGIKNLNKNEVINSLQSEKTGNYTTVFFTVFSKTVIFKSFPWDFWKWIQHSRSLVKFPDYFSLLTACCH